MGEISINDKCFFLNAIGIIANRRNKIIIKIKGERLISGIFRFGFHFPCIEKKVLKKIIFLKNIIRFFNSLILIWVKCSW